MSDFKVASGMTQIIVYRNNALCYMDIRKNKKTQIMVKKTPKTPEVLSEIYCTILMPVYVHLPSHKLSKVAHRG